MKNARRERFDFLGYTFGPYCFKGNGQWYLSAGVSKKSVQRLKAKVANLLAPGNLDPWLDVRDALNAFLFGWARYFSYGTHRAAFRGIDYKETALSAGTPLGGQVFGQQWFIALDADDAVKVSAFSFAVGQQSR